MCYNKIGAGREELILLPTTAEYLQDLVEQKNAFAEALSEKGVEASTSETLNTLVPKLDALCDEVQSTLLDTIQDYGNRRYYNNMFRELDNIDFIKRMRYDLHCKGATNMFRDSCYDKEAYPDGLDLVELLNEAGISLKYPSDGLWEATGMFYGSRISHIPEIRISAMNPVTQLFYNCTCLKTIDGLDHSRMSASSYWFTGCTALENITFIGQWNGSVDLSPCPLTVESILSLFNILVDRTTSTSTYTVTLGTDNLAKLTDEQKAIATEKGWTLA